MSESAGAPPSVGSSAYPLVFPRPLTASAAAFECKTSEEEDTPLFDPKWESDWLIQAAASAENNAEEKERNEKVMKEMKEEKDERLREAASARGGASCA